MQSKCRLGHTKPVSASTSSMSPEATTTGKQLLIARPRAPEWLSCELCERPASRPHRRLRLTLVRNSGDSPSDATGDERSSVEAANPAMLVLLCSDCCALIIGVIDEDEWRRRTDDSLATENRLRLPPPQPTQAQ